MDTQKYDVTSSCFTIFFWLSEIFLEEESRSVLLKHLFFSLLSFRIVLLSPLSHIFFRVLVFLIHHLNWFLSVPGVFFPSYELLFLLSFFPSFPSAASWLNVSLSSTFFFHVRSFFSSSTLIFSFHFSLQGLDDTDRFLLFLL